ncbi:enoyl-CoA hydratase [Pseudoscourfieldia marina]
MPAVALAKRAIDAADAFVALDDGLKLERSLFYDTFDLDDRREGMAAFCEKRKATFTDSAAAHANSSSTA